MSQVNAVFGAAIKEQFVNTLPEKERQAAMSYLSSFAYAEEMYQMHLYEMNEQQIVSTVIMSVMAPSGLSTAQAIKTLLVKYHKWAKQTGLVDKSNPLAKTLPIELCSELMIGKRYLKSIDELYVNLKNEHRIDSEMGKWSLIFLGLMLVYDGVEDTELSELKYDNIDYENKTLTTNKGIVRLSELTLQCIDEMKSYKSLGLANGRVWCRVGIQNTGHILPRPNALLQPLEGKTFMKTVSAYKKTNSANNSELRDAEWFTVDSIAYSGKFYRIYSGDEPNTLDDQMRHVYEVWKRVHYPLQDE